MGVKLTSDEIHRRMQEVHHGAIRFVTGYPGLITTRTQFTCHAGHIWEAPTHRILNKHGCPDCRGIKLSLRYRKPMGDIEAILTERHFKLLGEYTNMNATTDFQCLICDKVVSIQMRQACYALHGCPHCANKARTRIGGHSYRAIAWVDDLARRLRLKFRHNENGGEVRLDLGISKKGYTPVDGYNERYGIICEFDGDHWHKRKDRRSKQYKRTLKRTNAMLALGYIVIHVWCKDYESGDLGVVMSKDRSGRAFAKQLGIPFMKVKELVEL